MNREIVPSAAAINSLRTGGRPGRVAACAFSVIIFIVPVGNPFTYVAGHIHRAVGTCPSRLAADLPSCALAASVPSFAPHYRIAATRLFVAPRIYPPVAAPCRLFPFRLRRQSISRPFAECVGLIPIDADHRKFVVARFGFAPVAARSGVRLRALARRYALPILLNRDFKFVYLVPVA